MQVPRPSTVNVALLDMNSAFDKVQNDVLFKKMIKLGPPLTVHKPFWYLNSIMSLYDGEPLLHIIFYLVLALGKECPVTHLILYLCELYFTGPRIIF